MVASGSPSASSGSGFDVASTSTLNNKFGTLFYSVQGSILAPLTGGWLCVRPPTRRTGLQFSNGNAPPDDCSGAFHFDFNVWIASGNDPMLVAGQSVWCQYWSRDGGAPADDATMRKGHSTGRHDVGRPASAQVAALRNVV